MAWGKKGDMSIVSQLKEALLNMPDTYIVDVDKHAEPASTGRRYVMTHITFYASQQDLKAGMMCRKPVVVKSEPYEEREGQ